MESPLSPNEPPLIAPVERPAVSLWRWRLALLILGAYPIVLGLIPGLLASDESAPMLAKGTGALLITALLELFIFGAVFGSAWLLSRPSAERLFLTWRKGAQPIVRGLIYSVGLRILILIVILILVLFSTLLSGLSAEKVVEKLRPRTEAVVDPAALRADPLYFIIILTVISFGVAGLREELWRSGLLATLQGSYPQTFVGPKGGIAAVLVAAIVFGIGHLPQGWGGMLVTCVLGIGLGLIMVWHRSLWEAVFAHGFFDATTFVLLYSFPEILKQKQVLPALLGW